MACGNNGERQCKNWLDWRQNCHDPTGEYHQMFQCSDCYNGGSWTTSIIKTSYCVEYDIHPYCQSSDHLCDDPRCGKLPSSGSMPKELGLPFWKGKCDPKANTQRAEAMINSIMGDAMKGKHGLVNTTFIQNN